MPWNTYEYVVVSSIVVNAKCTLFSGLHASALTGAKKNFCPRLPFWFIQKNFQLFKATISLKKIKKLVLLWPRFGSDSTETQRRRFGKFNFRKQLLSKECCVYCKVFNFKYLATLVRISQIEEVTLGTNCIVFPLWMSWSRLPGKK